MAIYNLTAEFTTSDGRQWRSHWSRKAVGINDAIKRAKSDLALAGGEWKKIKAKLSEHQVGMHFIGRSGRLMMVERGENGTRGNAAQVRHVVNGEVRTISDLSPTESDFVWARVWDL